MAGLLDINYAPTVLRAAHRELTGSSRFAHSRPDRDRRAGRLSRKTDPRPTSLVTLIVPPSSLAFSSAIARPRPLPAPVLAVSAL